MDTTKLDSQDGSRQEDNTDEGVGDKDEPHSTLDIVTDDISDSRNGLTNELAGLHIVDKVKGFKGSSEPIQLPVY